MVSFLACLNNKNKNFFPLLVDTTLKACIILSVEVI
nr:MAG TPA: hypothetical protein [Caudoviricetes sp.]